MNLAQLFTCILLLLLSRETTNLNVHEQARYSCLLMKFLISCLDISGHGKFVYPLIGALPNLYFQCKHLFASFPVTALLDCCLVCVLYLENYIQLNPIRVAGP